MKTRTLWLATIWNTLIFFALVTASSGSDGPFPAGDELLVVNDKFLALAPLPNGPKRPEFLTLSQGVTNPREIAITFLDDGRLVAVQERVEGLVLVEIEEDGQVLPIGTITPDPRARDGEIPLDLVVDHEHRLYLLARGRVGTNPSELFHRLIHLDPTDATTLSSIDTGFVTPLARAPRGLWSLASETLHHLDPVTGRLEDTGIGSGSAANAATDSTGAIWAEFEGICSPPCFIYYRLDPITGAIHFPPPDLFGGFLGVRDLAIRRACPETPTSRCLQGGRFRAEVAWQNFDGLKGEARAAPARSADTSIFWFFDPANWELMVKVLDGCDINGHFWVFASASTSIMYDLSVADLETGMTRTYSNQLGERSPAVTDTAAFECRR